MEYLPILSPLTLREYEGRGGYVYVCLSLTSCVCVWGGTLLMINLSTCVDTSSHYHHHHHRVFTLLPLPGYE